MSAETVDDVPPEDAIGDVWDFGLANHSVAVRAANVLCYSVPVIRTAAELERVGWNGLLRMKNCGRATARAIAALFLRNTGRMLPGLSAAEQLRATKTVERMELEASQEPSFLRRIAVGEREPYVPVRLATLKEMAKTKIKACDEALKAFSPTLTSGSMVATYGGWMAEHLEKGRMASQAEKGAWETILRMLEGKAP